MNRFMMKTAAIAAITLLAVPVQADATPTPTRSITDDQIATQLAEHPGGAVSGNRVTYSDGSGFVAVPFGTLSMSQCASGEFCVWSSTSYSGSFTYVTGDGVTRTLGNQLGSLWNNRSRAARLYTNSGASSTCYAPGAKAASVSSSYTAAQKVFLASATAC